MVLLNVMCWQQVHNLRSDYKKSFEELGSIEASDLRYGLPSRKQLPIYAEPLALQKGEYDTSIIADEQKPDYSSSVAASTYSFFFVNREMIREKKLQILVERYKEKYELDVEEENPRAVLSMALQKAYQNEVENAEDIRILSNWVWNGEETENNAASQQTVDYCSS